MASPQETLPKQIRAKQYESELALLHDLFVFGQRDLNIVLFKDGFAVLREMPDEHHRVVVDLIMTVLDEWKEDRTLRSQKEANVIVSNSFNTPKNHLRVPDIGIFGPGRLDGRRIKKSPHNKKCFKQSTRCHSVQLDP